MMAKINFRNVDEYIAAQPASAQVILEHVRNAILKALPDAEEIISYKIPAYKLNDEIVLYFAGWKQHYSLYPADKRLVTAFKAELAPYGFNKATIRFPFSEPVRAKLIARIAQFRAREVKLRKHG